jgi:hypothetical protein
MMSNEALSRTDRTSSKAEPTSGLALPARGLAALNPWPRGDAYLRRMGSEKRTVTVVGIFEGLRATQHAVREGEKTLVCGEAYQPARFFFAGRHDCDADALAASGAGEVSCSGCRAGLSVAVVSGSRGAGER